MRRIDWLNKQPSKAGIAIVPHMAGMPTLKKQEAFHKWRDEEVDENGKSVYIESDIKRKCFQCETEFDYDSENQYHREGCCGVVCWGIDNDLC